MFPQILVHPPRAQAKRNLTLKTCNRITGHCEKTREQHPWCTPPKKVRIVAKDGQSCHANARVETRSTAGNSSPAKRYMFKNSQNYDLRCGDGRNVVHNTPGICRHGDAAPTAESRAEACNPTTAWRKIETCTSQQEDHCTTQQQTLNSHIHLQKHGEEILQHSPHNSKRRAHTRAMTSKRRDKHLYHRSRCPRAPQQHDFPYLESDL